MSLRLNLEHARRQFGALRSEQSAVHQHTGALHAQQHGHQRLLDIFIHRLQFRCGLDLRPDRLMQLQCHVRIFGGILRRLVDIHLIEGNFLRALAGDVFVVNGLDAEISLGRRIHVVPRRDAVQHIRLQHGIETLAGERDAVVCQHMRVELQVVTQLRLRQVFEYGLQRGKDFVPIELMRRPGVIMAQRHVSRFAGRNRESHADDARLHVVQTVGLGIE